MAVTGSGGRDAAAPRHTRGQQDGERERQHPTTVTRTPVFRLSSQGRWPGLGLVAPVRSWLAPLVAGCAGEHRASPGSAGAAGSRRRPVAPAPGGGGGGYGRRRRRRAGAAGAAAAAAERGPPARPAAAQAARRARAAAALAAPRAVGAAPRGGAGGRGGAAGGSGAGGARAATRAARRPAIWSTTFHNGGFWNDTTGKRIEAHGGGLIKVGDTWYWVGEDKSHNSGNFRGVNIYASKDLGNWEFRNAIITRSSAPDLMAADRIIERPKIVYNDATKQYVMWLHWEGQNYATAEAGVFTSPTVDGNYTLRSHFRPDNNMSRDDTLFKDDDGKAYFISAANENADLMLYELADDYLSIQRTVMQAVDVEARSAGDVQAERALLHHHVGGDGVGSQPGAVFVGDQHRRPVVGADQPGQQHHVRHAVDLRHPGAGVAGDHVHLCGRSLAGPRPGRLEVHLAAAQGQRHDAGARQLRRLAAERDHRALVGERRLPAAERAGRCSTPTARRRRGRTGARPTPSTTRRRRSGTRKYSGTTPAVPARDPDRSRRDLRAGRLPLPAPPGQGRPNGMVAQYQFYASTDRNNWGTAVASGTFNCDRDEKRVMFTRKTARYIRLVALSEINGGGVGQRRRARPHRHRSVAGPGTSGPASDAVAGSMTPFARRCAAVAALAVLISCSGGGSGGPNQEDAGTAPVSGGAPDASGMDVAPASPAATSTSTTATTNPSPAVTTAEPPTTTPAAPATTPVAPPTTPAATTPAAPPTTPAATAPAAPPTTPAATAPVKIRLAVIGDFGADVPDEAKVAALVNSWAPDHVLTVGDNNYPSGSAATIDANIGKYYHQFIGNYRRQLRRRQRDEPLLAGAGQSRLGRAPA